MGMASILSDIRKIISLENSDLESSYQNISLISMNAISFIKDNSIDIESDFYQFLDDFDIRRKDPAYREYQTRKVETLLSNIDDQHLPESKALVIGGSRELGDEGG